MITIPQNWIHPPTLQAATEIQRELAACVIADDQLAPIEFIAGMDVSNNPRDPAKMIYAAIVILDKQMKIVETVSVSMRENFPYVTGYLGFRETPALIEAWQQLKHLPQLIFVDGQGISHPRGLGIASHIGVLLDRPTIGVAKTILIGKPESEVGSNPGDHVPLLWKQRQVATLLRTKLRSNPLIISPGHKVSMTTATKLVMQYTRGYRLPEPTRQAHLAANACRRANAQT